MSKNTYLLRFLYLSFLIICTGFGGNPVRKKLKHIYDTEVGVHEKTGKNDGVRVETYLHYVRLSKGNPWCASFVCWGYGQAGIKNPESGYCPDLFAPNKIIYKRTFASQKIEPQQGDVWGLYFPEKRRVAHVGFVDQWGPKYVITVEGNTNEAGSREGDGVYRKRRLKSSIYIVANYIDIK